MSGHNKWSKIKRQKGVADIRKGKIFSQLSKQITLEAKNGGDPAMNPALKFVVEKAKQANMPADNVEKAIKKGTGELEGGAIEEVLYEAYGPEGIALIIEGTTDSTNRTVAEIKHILSRNSGRLGEAGSVKWMFDRFGYIEIDKKDLQISEEEAEMMIIDLGAEDFDLTPQPPPFDSRSGQALSGGDIENQIIVVYTKPEDLYKIKESLEKSDIIIGDVGFEWKAKNTIKIEDEKIHNRIEKLFEALDEQEDVNDVSSNFED
ncbi:MAG: YebC/PmpR family DNA-binding transcriptional regulator [Candidatus Pacebacteria bacterium]|nr:YebC/PmpR family DNA-binding transcriptional regulator [Candidatus Paceibacterota bacterium]